MNRSSRLAAAAAGTLVALAAVFAVMRASPGRQSRATAANTSRPIEATSAGEVDSLSELDEVALGELKRMGAYLRTLKAFQLKADLVTEDVRTDGQKVQVLRAVDLIARRPDRMFAEVTNDRQRRLFFYDGKNFTLYAPRPNYYATVPAPPTLAKLADQLEDKFNLQLPLVDLFRWGTPEGDVNIIKAAVDLGPSAINGVTCEQYAFRQEGLDWQLWVQRGENPLPCRVVITTLTDEARPQHMATYTWNLAPSYNDEMFVFHAPTGANKIPLAEVQTIVSSSRSERK
jgi:hypothetical protein